MAFLVSVVCCINALYVRYRSHYYTLLDAEDANHSHGAGNFHRFQLTGQ